MLEKSACNNRTCREHTSSHVRIRNLSNIFVRESNGKRKERIFVEHFAREREPADICSSLTPGKSGTLDFPSHNWEIFEQSDPWQMSFFILATSDKSIRAFSEAAKKEINRRVKRTIYTGSIIPREGYSELARWPRINREKKSAAQFETWTRRMPFTLAIRGATVIVNAYPRQMVRDFILESRQKSLSSGARNSWRNIYSGAQPTLPLCCRGKIKFREKSAVIFPSQIYLPLFKRDENKRQLLRGSGAARRNATTFGELRTHRGDDDKHERRPAQARRILTD